MAVSDMRRGYIDIVTHIRERGAVVPSQYGGTREVEDFSFVLTNPADALPVGVNRSFSRPLVAIEGLMLVGGIMDDELVGKLVPSMERYKEDNGQFWGSYGKRSGWQMASTVEKLRADPSTRQAVVAIWDPVLDVDGGKRDHPCTISLVFRVRSGALNMSVFMRSNDVWKGLAHDAGQFTTLQLSVAQSLGIPAGLYRHTASSMHLYDDDAEASLELRYDEGFAREYTPPPRAFGVDGGCPWSTTAVMAREALYGEAGDAWTPAMRWHRETIDRRLGAA
jgi:Thymidylate synthase